MPNPSRSIKKRMKRLVWGLIPLIFALAAPVSAEPSDPFPPVFELYLVSSWTGAPLESRIGARQQIPLHHMTVTLTDPNQVLYGYLLVKCSSLDQWSQWHAVYARDKAWRIDRDHERPKGASRSLNADQPNLEPYLFVDDLTDPSVREKAARKIAQEKLWAVWGFSVGPLKNPQAQLRKPLYFPIYFWSGRERRSVAELGVKLEIGR